MTEENLTASTNNPTSNTLSFTFNPTSTATATSYVPYTWPTYQYTTGGYLYAQLSESQLSDLEQRFRRVMRAELAHVLSALYESVKDYKEVEEEVEIEDEEEDDEEV